MYLKKLSLQGFKSFPNRTSFEFGKGVTGIVGPNGSGKSNVADAIRWVLGEQSVRLLRAKKTEDVIFAGTNARAQVGMAEVLLTLDNEDRWLPLDFAEVEIGRRAYRNGDSEYLLNGSRVRLKDIVDLLMHGDVGQNSYTIMGQGLVDEVLSMSADERRSFVDEAADVKRFRTKIKEAQDRLRATRDNMSQVDLIIREIEPRLSQLERQAGRAAEHAQLSARLRELLQRYYTVRLADAQNEVVRAGAMLDQRTAEHAEAEAKVAQLRDQVQRLGEEIRRRREAIARRDNRVSEMQQQVAQTEQAIALEHERHGMVVARSEELRAELESLEQEHASLASTDPDDERSDLDRQAELENARAAVQQSKQALDQAERRYSSLRARSQELRQTIEASERAQRDAEANIQAAERRLQQFERDEEQARERREKLLADLKDYGARFDDLLAAVDAAQSRLDNARAAAEDARRRLEHVQDEVRSYEQATQAEYRELDRLAGRLEALQRVHAEHEGVANGTRNVLVMGNALVDGVDPDSLGESPDVKGVVGLLSRQLKVPAGLEAAINAALEHRLHAVIVTHEDEAIRAIKLLQQRNQGRAQFLPLDSLRQVYPLNLQKERGVVGVASKLIKCDPRFRDLIDTLLGRIIVVDGIQDGLRMIRRSLGAVVTTDGTYIDPTGVISGGSLGSEEGVFVRQRELDELPLQIEELRDRVAVSERQLENGHAAVQRLVNELREADDYYDQIRKSGDDGRLALERERDRLHRLRRDMDAVSAKEASIERERASAEQAIRIAKETIQQAAASLVRYSEDREALESELGFATEGREVALRELSDASERLASVEGEHKAAEMLRRQHQQAVDRLTAQLEARRTQARNLDDEAAAIQERQTQLARQLEALRLQQANQTDEAAPDRDELDRFENRERQLQDELALAREDFLRIERGRLDSESDLYRARELVEALRVEMERDGLGPDRYGNVVSLDDAIPDSDLPSEYDEAIIRGSGDVDVQALRKEIESIRRQIRRLGPINAEAPEDYRESKERYTFLLNQMEDLSAAEAQLNSAIAELSDEINVRFAATFEMVNSAFGEYFSAFFGGGAARMRLTDTENLAESGIDIEAQPPGKRINSLSLLSGGERSLTAVALLFALLSVNPAPFCVLDEVDAALDEANVGRFTNSLRQLSEKTQFLAVTHNRRTVEAADAIYGISMAGDGVSKVISLKLEDLKKDASPLGQ